MNSAWDRIYDATISSALEMMRSVSGMDHTVVKGSLREVMLDELIRPMLPRTYGVGTGVIVDYQGEISPSESTAPPETPAGQSGQQDLVVYDPEVLPPVLEMHRTGVYPIEAVLSVIEVTSNLDTAALKTIMWRALRLYSLKYTGDVIDAIAHRETDDNETKAVSINTALASMQEAWRPYVCTFGLSGNKDVLAMHKKAAQSVKNLCASKKHSQKTLNSTARERLTNMFGEQWWDKLSPYVLMVTIPDEGCSRYEKNQIRAFEHKNSEFPYVASFLGILGMEVQCRRLMAGYRIPTLYLFKGAELCS